jgi:hypothetical protein
MEAFFFGEFKDMKIFFFTATLLTFLFSNLFASQYPRQKVTIKGLTKSKNPTALDVQTIEKLKAPLEIEIFDPYNKNIKTTFTGYYLKDLIELYAQTDYKIINIVAIDGYKVDLPKDEMIKTNLFLAYKDNKGYLSVDRMGPVRIIAPVKGIINKDELLKLGVYWVWQVKSFEIKN